MYLHKKDQKKELDSCFQSNDSAAERQFYWIFLQMKPMFPRHLTGFAF